jgi:geranylgeranyl diphosphate synthase type I
VGGLDLFTTEAVRACALVREAVPRERWPIARDVVETALAGPPPPLAALPLAACVAAGGRAEAAIPAAAAWIALNLALRIYDDAMDEDRPDALWATLGHARATVVAGMLRETATLVLTRAACPAELTAVMLRDISTSLVHVAAGQDRDLSGAAHDLASWWQIMTLKTGHLFALACRIGARFGGATTSLLEALTRYGSAAGMAFQLVDDWGSTAPSPDARDLAIGKRTTAIWLALTMASPADRTRLEALLAAPPPWDAASVGQILDASGARPYTLWLAHRAADRAHAALASLPASRVDFLVEFARAPLPPLPAAPAPATSMDALPWLRSELAEQER